MSKASRCGKLVVWCLVAETKDFLIGIWAFQFPGSLVLILHRRHEHRDSVYLLLDQVISETNRLQNFPVSPAPYSQRVIQSTSYHQCHFRWAWYRIEKYKFAAVFLLHYSRIKCFIFVEPVNSAKLLENNQGGLWFEIVLPVNRETDAVIQIISVEFGRVIFLFLRRGQGGVSVPYNAATTIILSASCAQCKCGFLTDRLWGGSSNSAQWDSASELPLGEASAREERPRD